MTLGELAENISRFIRGNPGAEEAPVYLSKDGEGNEFRPLDNSLGTYDPEELDLDDEDTKVVALWPTW